LAKFVKTFGKGESKGMFPYEAFDYNHYDEYLNSIDPSPIKDFDSFLRRSQATEDDYNNIYLKGWEEAKLVKSKISKKQFTRKDHIEYYNKNDVEIMIPSVLELISFAFEDKVDMLQNFSLASVAVQKRYASIYEDFNISENYEKANELAQNFYFDFSNCLHMCQRYKEQDKEAKRNADNVINPQDDYEALKDMFTGDKIIETPINYKQVECYVCHKKFSSIIKPTLDRLNNNVAHELNNVVPCCRVCNFR
jgi:hypothetical protein